MSQRHANRSTVLHCLLLFGVLNSLLPNFIHHHTRSSRDGREINLPRPTADTSTSIDQHSSVDSTHNALVCSISDRPCHLHIGKSRQPSSRQGFTKCPQGAQTRTLGGPRPRTAATIPPFALPTLRVPTLRSPLRSENRFSGVGTRFFVGWSLPFFDVPSHQKKNNGYMPFLAAIRQCCVVGVTAPRDPWRVKPKQVRPPGPRRTFHGET